VLILTALALCVIANRIHPSAATITPFMVLGYPLVIYAASLLYPQVLGCLLLTITVMLISSEQLSERSSVAAGLSYGILILSIPYFVLMLPVLAAYILLRHDSTRLARVRAAILLMGAAALIVTPWTVRNYLRLHSFIPVSANGGQNLFIGNSPDTTPNGGLIAIDPISHCKRVVPGIDINQIDGALGKCAIDWITENPRSAAKLYVRKVINYFNFRNELTTKNAAAPWTDLLLFVTYYPLLLTVIARAALFRRFPFNRTEGLIYLLYFANAFISAIYFTRIRFRIPFDLMLITVAAGFLCKCWDARRRRSPGAQLATS
jgi:hypothetical protein